MGICESKENNNKENNNNVETKFGNSQPSQMPQKTFTNDGLIRQNENIYKINESLLSSTDKTDIILKKLLQGRKNPRGIEIDLKEDEIKYIINTSLSIIEKENMLLELQAPINICGDIHGQFGDLLRIFGKAGYPDKFNYLFLGNYVDFGKQSMEVLCLLLCFKIKFPQKIWLLRGNHESSSNKRTYDFYNECQGRYNLNLYSSFLNLFNFLPVAAIIDEKIFCVHGGLSPDLKNIKDISEISRPTEIPEAGLLCDLLNSDPDEDVNEYDENDKGISITFGEKIVHEFLKNNNLDMIVRGNQVANDGYKFFAKKKLVTVFSAPDFKGEYTNAAGILKIKEDLTCDFQVIKN